LTWLSTTTARAEVTFYGLDITDLVTADPVAVVTIDPGLTEQQLARFVGMSVVAMLRGGRIAGDYVQPFAEIGQIACEDLLNRVAVPEPAEYSLAEAWRPTDVAFEIEQQAYLAEYEGQRASTDSLMTIAFPRVGGEPVPGKRRRFRAQLEEGRKGSWVNLRSRNPMLSAWGVLCLFEQIARGQPLQTTERVATVGKRLFDLHERYCGKAGSLSFDQATAMYAITSQLAAAEDPLTADLGLD
jgi:hypothetical protein